MSILKGADILSDLVVMGADVIGLPVITHDTGTKIEKVEDIVFDHISNQVIALTVDTGGWRKKARVLPWGGIHSIGNDAVVAKNADVIVSAEDLLGEDRILELKNALTGKKLMTEDGHELGKVNGIYFNPNTGVIVGFEVSGGIFSDVMSGRSFVPAAEIVKFGDDRAFVSPATATMFEEQVGGLKRSMQSMQDEWRSMLERFESIASDVRGSADSVISTTTSTVQTMQQQADKLDLGGRFGSMKDQGQQALSSAADGAQNLVSRVQEGLDEKGVGERANELASQSGDAVRDTADRIRTQLKDLLSERVVEQAKGLRAARSVLNDAQEYVVVAGQKVTNDVIEKARKYGKEQDLINSVGLDLEEVVESQSSTLRSTVEKYASELHKHGDTVVDSLRKTAVKVAGDVKTRLKRD